MPDGESVADGCKKGAGFQRPWLHSGQIRGGVTRLPGGSTAVINCWTWVKRVFILPILRSQRCRLFVIAFDLEYLPVSLMDEDTAPVITVPGAGSFDPVWVACHYFLVT